jgi:hypothetical protein
VLTAFLAAAGACLAQSAPEAAREPLFNSRDLAGWRAYREGRWEVIDGAIHGILEGKGGCWLLTERELGDAKLCLSYSLPEKGNGGSRIFASLHLPLHAVVAGGPRASAAGGSAEERVSVDVRGSNGLHDEPVEQPAAAGASDMPRKPPHWGGSPRNR